VAGTSSLPSPQEGAPREENAPLLGRAEPEPGVGEVRAGGGTGGKGDKERKEVTKE